MVLTIKNKKIREIYTFKELRNSLLRWRKLDFQLLQLAHQRYRRLGVGSAYVVAKSKRLRL
jgi:hypothetical protein